MKEGFSRVLLSYGICGSIALAASSEELKKYSKMLADYRLAISKIRKAGKDIEGSKPGSLEWHKGFDESSDWMVIMADLEVKLNQASPEIKRILKLDTKAERAGNSLKGLAQVNYACK